VVAGGLLLWGVSVPGGYYGVVVAALLAWLAVGVAWLATGVRYLGSLPERRFRRWWPLLLVPVVFAANVVTASGDLVGRALFPLHRAELERWAAAEAAAPAATPPPPWDVGIYSFESVGWQQGCMIYATERPAMAPYAGFAWCPGVAPMSERWSDGQVFERLDGDWYVVSNGDGRPWGLHLSRLHRRTEV
jgi:hypothetical protein